MHPNAILDSCADLLAQVLKFEHPADAVTSRYFREHKYLGPRERATLAETAFKVLRNKLLFEFFARNAGHSVGQTFDSKQGLRLNVSKHTRRLAILGFHGERDFLKAALNADEAQWLAACDATPTKDLFEPHRHNLPEWLAAPLQAQAKQRWGAQADAQFWALAGSLQQAAALDLRVNAFKAKRTDVSKALAAVGIKATETPYSPWGLRVQGKPSINKLTAFTDGLVEVQDEGSQLLAQLVGAARGQMVVDFCAGAGGKTLALGAAMRNTGRLYAFDTSAHRLDALKPRLARSGLSNVHPVAIAHERDERIKRLAGKIDAVLIDAPCSGLGTLRRNPDLKWRQSPQAVTELAVKQTAILQSAARLLKVGGRLVYATCSLLDEENEQVAAAFGAANPGFAVLPVLQILTEQKVSHAADLCEGDYLRLWTHKHQTDGFFAAVWQRVA
jgi:16S rRNA (cytosine967-C5)-methyltransferase